MINETPGDKLKQFIQEEIQNDVQNSVLQHPLTQVLKFLTWKIRNYPESVNAVDKLTIESNNISEILQLNPESCKYTKEMMNKYIDGNDE